MKRSIPAIPATASIIASLSSTSLLVSCQQQQQQQQHSNCDVSSYYSTISDMSNRNELHTHIKNTHRTSLPYTSSSTPDVWTALSSIDTDETGEDILLVYSDKYVPTIPHDAGTCDYWNREHVWPRSRGVGESGVDNTDLHHVRPVDCNVNSARGNLFFGSCSVAGGGTDNSDGGSDGGSCTTPAHSEAATDTQKNKHTFLPPANQRGDVARAILYMDLRYDGDDEDNVENLVVTDCPEGIDNAMGYLSQLLQWHVEDPPDELEKERNDSICRDWQGNRNPFIDHPELVSSYFRSPQQIPEDGSSGYDCSSTLPPAPASTPTSPSTPSTPSSPATSDESDSCLGMEYGDIAIIGMKSLDPDAVFLLALADLSGGVAIYMSDNAWTGSSLKSNEGVLRLDIPKGGIARGSIFGYDPSSSSSTILTLGNSWSKISGNFALSGSGDNVMVYCVKSDTSPRFIFAALYQDDWSPENTDPSSFSTNESARPGHLPDNCSVSLVDGKNKNWWYQGAMRQGTKSELLNSISERSRWSGDDASFYLNTDTEFQINRGIIMQTSMFWAIKLAGLALAFLY